jgi:pimeloyl-ACP methyl ester carboxylesterase
MSLLPAVTPHLDWLREQAVTEIVCVGAGLGANLCLHLAVNDPSVSSVVLLSPGINRHNVKIVPALREYGERPLLVVASTEDVYSARSIEVMDRLSDQMSVQMLEGAGSGTVMLNRDAELEGRMMGWILGTDQVNARSLTVPTTAAETEEDSIETSGEKLLIHQ